MFDDVPFVLAFTGGLVATVNPCGFAMLPAYLSFFLGVSDADSASGRTAAVTRALRVGMTVAAGFALVFAVAGLVLTLGARTLTTALPWAALVVGMSVALLGMWLLTGRAMPVRLPAPARAGDTRSGGAVFVFGLGYAVASLSCTLPVFLAVVAGTATRQSVGSALAVFGVYAVGMALPLLAVTVALALGRDTLVQRVRGLGRHTNRVGGGLLLLAGAYVVLFWATELTGVTSGPARSLVLGVELISARLTTLIGERPLLFAVVFSVVVAAALAIRLHAYQREHRSQDPNREPARSGVPQD